MEIRWNLPRLRWRRTKVCGDIISTFLQIQTRMRVCSMLFLFLFKENQREAQLSRWFGWFCWSCCWKGRRAKNCLFLEWGKNLLKKDFWGERRSPLQLTLRMRQPHQQRQPNAPSAVTSPPVPPSVTPLRRETLLKSLSCDDSPSNGEWRRQKPFGVEMRFLETGELRKATSALVMKSKFFRFSFHHLFFHSLMTILDSILNGEKCYQVWLFKCYFFWISWSGKHTSDSCVPTSDINNHFWLISTFVKTCLESWNWII